MPTDTDDEMEKCAVATNAAFEVAMDECSPDALLMNLARMTGLQQKPDRDDVPGELSTADCMEMEMVREWVAVRSEQLIDDGEGVSDAIEQAWDEVSEQCGW